MTMLIYAKPMTKPRKLTVDWARRERGFIAVRFAFSVTEAPTEDEVYRAAFTAMNEYSYEPREDVKLIAQVAIRTNVRLKTAERTLGWMAEAINKAASCAGVELVFTWDAPPGHIAVSVTEAA